LTATEMASSAAKRVQAPVEPKSTYPYGELRTTVGSVVIKDRRTVKLTKEMLHNRRTIRRKEGRRRLEVLSHLPRPWKTSG